MPCQLFLDLLSLIGDAGPAGGDTASDVSDRLSGFVLSKNASAIFERKGVMKNNKVNVLLLEKKGEVHS